MNNDNDIINTNIDPAANTFAYGVEVDYKQNESVKFQDFMLTFKSVLDVTADDGTIISLQTNNFLIVDNNQKELLLKIGNGQLPNPPSSFEVDNNNFTLWTYKGPEDNTLKNSTLIVTKE